MHNESQHYSTLFKHTLFKKSTLTWLEKIKTETILKNITILAHDKKPWQNKIKKDNKDCAKTM